MRVPLTLGTVPSDGSAEYQVGAKVIEVFGIIFNLLNSDYFCTNQISTGKKPTTKDLCPTFGSNLNFPKISLLLNESLKFTIESISYIMTQSLQSVSISQQHQSNKGYIAKSCGATHTSLLSLTIPLKTYRTKVKLVYSMEIQTILTLQ